MWKLDQELFYLVNGFAERMPNAEAFAIFLAQLLIFIMVAAVIFMLVWELTGRKTRNGRIWPGITLRSATALLLALVGNLVISVFYLRPRPFVSLPDADLLIGAPSLFKSFPSDHASVSFAIAVTVFLAKPRIGAVFLAAAALVAFGRVFAGVHYPLDVLAGALVGLLWALVVKAGAERIGKIDSGRTKEATKRNAT